MPVEFAATKNVILAQKVGEQLVKLHYETAALQVKFADGTDLATKFAALSDAVAGQSATIVVADIAARDAIASPKIGDQCWVKDATGDSTVKSGAAKYLYESAETGWVKTAEVESLDVILDWADIRNKPTSTVQQIDTAVIDTATNKADVATLKTDVESLETRVETLETGAAKKWIMHVETLPDAVPEDLCEGGLLIVG